LSGLADQVIEVAKPYLGLAARDIVRRSAKRLVGTDLSGLGTDHLGSLAYWIRIDCLSKKLMDEERANSLAEVIRRLAET
jgi:hypothetical protein